MREIGDDLSRDFKDFFVAASDAGQIILYDLLATLSPPRAHSTFDTLHELVNGRTRALRERVSLQEDTDEDDAHHADSELGIRGDQLDEIWDTLVPGIRGTIRTLVGQLNVIVAGARVDEDETYQQVIDRLLTESDRQLGAFDQEVKRLRQEARDGSEEAAAQLLETLGLQALDEVFPSGQPGSIIGKVLTIARLSESACNVLRALRNLFQSSNGTEAFTMANLYIDAWRNCADLPAITTVHTGANTMAEKVMEAPWEVRLEIVAAINRAMRCECDE